MTQHFLLMSKARSLSLRRIFSMSEDKAFETFKRIRWGDGEEVGCPLCEKHAKHYFIKTRKQWRCKACNHTFSVTSGTIFAFHKLPLKVYLAAIAAYANSAKGLPALQLSRYLDVQYKTAFVLSHKIRESLVMQRNNEPLSGEVHIDGTYVNGYVRPHNKKENRVDRRLLENKNPNERCVIVMREKDKESNIGAKRTFTSVIKSENQTDIDNLTKKYLKTNAMVNADDNKAYDILHARFDTRRVNHQKEYRADDGTTNNLAESYFSRFKRMIYGQMHHISNLYLYNYANEIAYREDTRRLSNGEIFDDITRKCMGTITHKDWCGYWQKNKKSKELLAC